MQNITPNDWLQIAENDNFPFVANLLNALTFISNKNKMLEVLSDHLDEWSFTDERAELIKTFYPANHETIIAKWKSECCQRCGACPEEVTYSLNIACKKGLVTMFICGDCHDDADTPLVLLTMCASKK